MESRKVKYRLGAVSRVDPVTFGQPGQRTFKLEAQVSSAVCSVWMEKEQLFQLGVFLQDAVGRLPAEDSDKEGQPKDAPWSGGEATIDFRAGQIQLSHDPESNHFYLEAHERENPEEEEPAESESVSFWLTVSQAVRLSEESIKICAAGRPTCFLCGQPINPDGHVCPRANGHTVLEAG